jgi:hypothetical protein
LLFLDLEPPRFCSTPLVLKLAIQDIQPFSVIVSWQSRNHSGLHGFRVAYHALDRNDAVCMYVQNLAYILNNHFVLVLVVIPRNMP